MLLCYAAESTDSNPQTLLFSATLPHWVHETAKKYLRPDRRHFDLVCDDNVKTSKTVRVGIAALSNFLQLVSRSWHCNDQTGNVHMKIWYARFCCFLCLICYFIVVITSMFKTIVFSMREHMLSALYAITHPSLCLSVIRVDQSKTVEVRIVQFSLYSSSIPLLFTI